MGQFKALAYKNWILYKRTKIGSLCELLIPIVAASFIIFIVKLINVVEYPQQQYWNNQNINATFPLSSNVQQLAPYFGNCQKEQLIALIPQTDIMILQLANDFQKINLKTQFFKSDEDLNQYVRSQSYGIENKRICFGITSVNSKGPNYIYKLRFNSSSLDAQRETTTNLEPITSQKSLQLNFFKTMAAGGMAGVNNLINNYIIKDNLPINSLLKNTVGPIYQQNYVEDPIYDTFSNSVEILIVLPLLVIYIRQISLMLTEKQKKIRESMEIMGMKTLVYYLTWGMRTLIIFLVIHSIISGILTIALFSISFWIFFTLFVLFDLVLIVQAMFIQIFFTKAKMGIIVGVLFFFLQYLVSLVVTSNGAPLIANVAVSLLPHTALVLSIRTALYSHSIRHDLSFIEQQNSYTIMIAIVSFIVNFIIWTALTAYLDQVFPNQWGNKKHPLFCCIKKERQQQQNLSESKQHYQKKMQMNQFSVDLQELDTNGKPGIDKINSVILKRVTKHFGQNTIAVNNLTIGMHQNQIFALLGHNGAGKTTTISMITGMIDPTEGQISVMGQTEVSKYRKFIGICPQHDTLYDQLTVEEHLYLYGTFKNFDSDQLYNETQKLIKDVNLQDKKQEYVCNLSGGQKRRLSVALSFVGGSKVIILDQPTSGMDTSARRYIWEMLQSYKQKRVIILTTHFMDEADYLGDRIAIMGAGRLKCCGSSMYLKKKYGVGYNITFVKQDSNTPSSPILKKIKQHVKNANVISDVSSQFSAQLPLQQVSQFENLFQNIDKEKVQLGIRTYGISITTLQEVFLKVSQNFQQQKPKEKSFNYEISLKTNNYQSNAISKYIQADLIQSQRKIEQEEEINEIIRQDSQIVNFLKHIKATVQKRFRVIRRDKKSFLFQLLLPFFIILLACSLMKISFVKDDPQRQISFRTFAQDHKPVQFGLAGTSSNIVNKMNIQLKSKYDPLIDINIDFSNKSPESFDLNFLKQKKLQNKYFRGGIYVQEENTTNFVFNTIVNTRSIQSTILLPNLAIEAFINSQKQTDKINITVINAPLAQTFALLSINHSVSGFFAAFIFTIAFSFKFASIMAFIVKQRAQNSKHQQIVSGIHITSYWLGNFIYDYFLYLILAVSTCLLILAFDIQEIMEDNGYVACWIILILFGLSYIPLTYIVGFLFTDYGTAQSSWYFASFLFGGLLPIGTLILRMFGSDTNTIGQKSAWILRINPAFSFGEGLINLASRALYRARQSIDTTAFNMTISLAPIIFLAIGTFLYPTILLSIQKISNIEVLMRIFNRQFQIEEKNDVEDDDDVKKENQKVNKIKPEECAILTKQLRKVFRTDTHKGYKIAVDEISLAIQEGEVFGLLGVNGAGKSTTFKMLCGQLTSTSGQIYFMGLKVNDNLRQIRKNLGYCPQFDALIDNLTVKEQLELYYDIKSLPGKNKQEIIKNKMKEIDLIQYEDKLSGQLSGGNKRKLSTAIAMLGNPKVIFLDEPSTGMDPKARRNMWKVISQIVKKKRSPTFVLTTHSMQEAQALSTRLGIMVAGRLKCIGTTQYIKSKFGEGYEIQIKITNPNFEQVLKCAKDSELMDCEGNISIDQLQKSVQVFQISRDVKEQIAQDKVGGYLIKNNKISLTNLIEYSQNSKKFNKILEWMSKQLGETTIIEKYYTYIRFKCLSKVSVGKMFGLLQKNKDQLCLSQYSVKQASVEQIFNKFAKQNGVELD